jgi:BirA family transcriptional regulator, biotin operon repressor / biotin---[acetyl-CoA-carboxylase] ligase
VIDWSEAADERRRVGHHVEVHAEIGSTNDRAAAALDEPRGEGSAIVAELQTAGRGRRGRQWDSPAGLNLTLSVGLRPRLAADRAGLLGIATALAVRAACAPAATLAVKWPNDLVAPDGRKVAGLLLETALLEGQVAQAVIGVGINVKWRRSTMPEPIAGVATSLADLAGHDLDRVALLGRLLTALDDEIAALERGLSPVDRFAAASWLDGRQVTVSLGARELDGLVEGIGADGSLLLLSDAGRVALTAGEVQRVRGTMARA